jgi:hypothetical protein
VHGDRDAEAREVQRDRIELRMRKHRLEAFSKKPSAIVAANGWRTPWQRLRYVLPRSLALKDALA